MCLVHWQYRQRARLQPPGPAGGGTWFEQAGAASALAAEWPRPGGQWRQSGGHWQLGPQARAAAPLRRSRWPGPGPQRYHRACAPADPPAAPDISDEEPERHIDDGLARAADLANLAELHVARQ